MPITTQEREFQELARKYHLEPTPESVSRLSDLVAQQGDDLDTVGKIISKDPALTARLIRAANPRAESEEDYGITTVDEALMRMGIGSVLLLAMSTPLSLAIVKTFQTMLGMKLETVNPKTATPFSGEHLLGTIGFSGKAEGNVYLRLDPEGAKLIASRILDMKIEELNNGDDITDAVGELLNIVTGNFKSNLCDAGLHCKLQVPSITRTRDFSASAISGGGSERMAFCSSALTVFMDVTVNPWRRDE